MYAPLWIDGHPLYLYRGEIEFPAWLDCSCLHFTLLLVSGKRVKFFLDLMLGMMYDMSITYQPRRTVKRETPQMTQRDFEFIADTIRDLFGPEIFEAIDISVIAAHFADALTSTNGMFKRERFIDRATKGLNMPLSVLEVIRSSDTLRVVR